MQDLESGSLWSHITGDGMMGKYEGRTLSTVPVVQTTWSDWSQAHPDTKLLRKSRAVRSSAYEAYFKDPEKHGIFRTEWLRDRMPGKALVHGIADGPHSLAVSDEEIKRGKPLQTSLGEGRVLVVRASDNGVRAYRARTSSGGLTLRPGTKSGQFVDKETGSHWDLDRGVCSAGKRKGEHLEPLQVTVAFWFAWSTFYPNTGIAP
jgi:hypothetical protein